MVPSKMSPVAVCVAPFGARHVEVGGAALALDADELAREAAACAEAGATVLHLRVRDAEGRRRLDPELYRASLRAIRAEVGDRLVVQIAAEAAGARGGDEPTAIVRELRPESASIALRELAGNEASLRRAEDFCRWAAGAGVGLQHVAYSGEEAARLVDLARRGVLAEARPHAAFVVGREGDGRRPAPRDLAPFLEHWPGDWPFTAVASGLRGARCLAAAVALGGHARVGFEADPALAPGKHASRDAALVGHVRALVACSGRRLASVDEARALYGTPGRDVAWRVVRASHAAAVPLLLLARSPGQGRALH